MKARTFTSSVGALSLAGALLLSACGGGSGATATDDTGDSSGGSSAEVSISSSDGSLVVGADTLPDGFPSEVATPEGFTIVAGAKTTVDGKDNFTITFSADGDKTSIVKRYVDSLKSDGYTVDSEFTGGSDGSDGGVWQLSNTDWKVGIIASKDGTKTVVIANVAPADS